MNISERIQQVRSSLKLSRKAFGEVLGVSGDVINNIEGNRLKRPEQKEPIYKLICQKFNVSYDWLMTGQGEMFEDLPEALIDELAIQYKLDDIDKEIIHAYLELTDDEREVIKKYLKKLSGK